VLFLKIKIIFEIDLDSYHGNMIKIYTIGFMLLFIAMQAHADAQEGDKNWDKWAACSEDIECVAIHNACGGWTAVNMKYKNEGEQYQNKLATMVDCADFKMEPEPKILCLKEACSVKPSLLLGNAGN